MRTFVLKALSIFLGFLLAFILSEIFFVLYYVADDKKYLSVKEKLEQEKNSFLHNVTKDGDCSYEATLGPHPYLAFTHHSLPSCNFEVNNVGHYGRDFPVKKEKGKFVIMITGGSVATQVGRMTVNTLEELLNQRYELDNKEFVVLNGALEAWKQPQQLIMLSLYGNVIDGLITLDGFNEVVFNYNIQYRASIEKPWWPSYLAANPQFTSKEFPLVSWLNNEIYQATRKHWLFSHSKTFYFMSKSVRDLLGRSINMARSDSVDTLESLFRLPEKWPLEERRDWHMQEYQRYVTMMNSVSNQLNIKAAFFIQPVPAIEKKLTNKELESVGDLSYRDDYLLAEKRLLSLKDIGVPVFSLTGIYSEYDETLYYDAVHQNEDSVGYRIMADHIVNTVGKEWGLRRKSAL